MTHINEKHICQIFSNLHRMFIDHLEKDTKSNFCNQYILQIKNKVC